ncbi:AAA ATPase midasin, partial [Linderina pennispora]
MPEFQMYEKVKGMSTIAWTKAMRRLFILTALCLRFHEPVLLVGETGCGKTTVCQMLAEAKSQLLHIVNCHQNTESSDILGGQRPVRNRNALITSAHEILAQVLGSEALASRKIDTPELLKEFIEQWQANAPEAQQIIEAQGGRLEEAYELMTRSQDLFAWHDGPLVQAMKQGDMFLMDELNLADDSVLERLNSVLEPSRTLVLAEQIGAAALVGADGFEFVATMNPGGDYGKRELSPALRNRFTELWAPTTTDSDDLAMILDKRLAGVPDAAACTRVILEFVKYLDSELKVLQHPLSLRDYLFWAEFISKTHSLMDSRSSVVHGACLVLLDSVGTQGSIFNTTTRSPAAIKAECVDRLRDMVEWGVASGGYELGVVPARTLIADRGLDLMSMVTHTTSPHPSVGVAPFLVAEGSLESSSGGFALHAPTTFDNLVKILRAMQVGKPLLLEGSPGVGKTTLVSTLAKLAGHRLVRINLSDQTDLMDLFGTDLPVDDGFAWCDAPFLQALKQGDWVLLDEINLASQSVLEGLNSCLDHRGTVYISELDREFTLSPGFRLFAAQNPLGQGGGRKGLPRSFVNRFTQVYMDELTRDDLQIICDNIYNHHASIERVLEFNWRMHSATMVKRLFGSSGSPWEFNLRDVSRFMELALARSPLEQSPKPVDEFIEMLYVHRMRTHQDRVQVIDLYNDVFGAKLALSTPSLHITEQMLQVGNAVLPRRTENARITRLRSLHSQLPYMESLMKCIEMRWMAIMVGAAGSGKTSLVRWLANATGNKLVEFSMNSGVDTSEILGGFEQVDMQRHHLALVRKIGKLVNLAVFASSYQNTKQLAQLCSVYHATRHCTRAQDLCALVEQIAGLASVTDELFVRLLSEIQAEMADFAALEVAGKFEWVDGILVDALLNGHWLLIDRANLCSASVLDRLNGLLEPNGVLYVNEDPKRQDAIVPHDNFRIIMAVDPQYGELSRAMRNRGIEICVLPSESSECRSDDQSMVAEAIGVGPSLLHGDVSPQDSLTGIVQYAMQLAERTQRGAVAVSEATGDATQRISFVVDPIDSTVSVAKWQSALIRHGLSSGDAVFGQRMLLAALNTLPPKSLSDASLKAIVGNGLVDALLDSPISASTVAARKALAGEAGVDAHLLDNSPLYAPLNHSMFRVLQRHADGPAARWHQALVETLMFQRERLVYGKQGGQTERELVLQRPNLDIGFIETVFALIDGCDELVATWESFITDASAVEPIVAASDGDLGKYVARLRTLHLLKLRTEKLLAAERGTASELAVAFESMQSVLSQLSSMPSPANAVVERLLGIVKGLVLDASYSAKLWTLVHPTTLADEQSREIEQRLVAAAKAADPEQRSTITEALAMLYATTTRKDRHLVLAALAKFADSLVASEPNAAAAPAEPTTGEPPALSPIEIITDVSELTSWHAIADLAIVAGSLPSAMAIEDLLRIVKHTNVKDTSSWALLFTRLNWALNDAQHSMLPLFSDIAFEWYQRLNDHAVDGAISASNVSRINLPVATSLTLQQAGQLDCAISDREAVARESRQLLRALSRFRAAARTPATELAVLLALVMQVASVLTSKDIDQLATTSESIIATLRAGNDVNQELVRQWHAELTAIASPVADTVKPAADALAAALDGLRPELVYVAWIEIGVCMLMVSLPKRPVDPAAKAQTRFDWLGEDHAVTEADLIAYRLIQHSMTGETATAATRPISDKLSSIDSERSAIELVYRPKASTAPFSELWQEAKNLQKNVLARARDVYEKLLDPSLTASGLQNIQGSAKSLDITLEQFESRVKRRYFSAYRDVAQIWCTYVHHIKYGLLQLVELRKAAVNDQMMERAAMINSLYLQPIASQPASHMSNANMQSLLSQIKTLVYFTPDSNPIKVYGELIVTLLMRTTLGVQFRGHIAPSDLEALDMVFRDAYEIHQRAVDEKRKRDIEASKLFKSKVTKEQTDEELMAEIFPGFEDLYDAEDEVTASYEDLSDSVVGTIAACHQYVMLRFGVLNGARDVQPKLIEDAQQSTFRLAASLNRIRPDLLELQGPGIDESLRGANLLSLAAVASATTADVSSDMQTDGLRFVQVCNFYKDAKPSEAILLKPLVAGIVERMEQLLEEWPDHAVLQDICKLARQLLQLPVTAPLAKLLTGLEMLYQKSQEWQAYASRDVSIEQLADVARLIVRWRQQELNAWPHLLLSQELEFARRPNEWWFNLYSSLLGDTADFAGLVSAIDQFMQGSPAGEFRGRLNMLHAFCGHRAALLSAQALQEHKSVMELKRSDPVYAPLSNAIDYYSQYAVVIAEHLAAAKKAVKKDLTQYVKISSWKDVNPAALKESALRTHRHLTKCVRQWREALSQPIFQIIQIAQSANIAHAKVPTVQLVPLPLSDAGIEVAPMKALATAAITALPWGALEIDDQKALELAKLAPDSLAKVLELSPAHLQQLHRMMKRSDIFTGSLDGSSSPDTLEEFALQMVGDINHFQNVETPKHLTKKPVTGKSEEPSKKKKKLIIKSKKQAEDEEDEYIEDDEERQRKIMQFWGEQRNLRRTRLKEILKALAGLGLKRNFRPVADEAQGLSSVLKQPPLATSAWSEAVHALATCNVNC